MGAVRLGKISFRWCMECNVPVIELEQCGSCGSDTHQVSITPPGDYRPAFEHDIRSISRTIDTQFGDGTGDLMLPKEHIAVLNKCPAVDSMDEVIADGMVLGTHAFEPGTGWRFICRLEGAARIAGFLKRSWVRVDNGAIPFIRKGASTMAVGVLDADKDIKPGHEVIVLSEEGDVVSTGRARMSGTGMLKLDRGAAVKSRWYKEFELKEVPVGGRTWQDTVRANLPLIQAKEAKAARYILRTVERFSQLPVVVSVSGGKDSLATLLLVLEAGLRPELLFIDTGLEFPETIENVQRTADEHDLDLIVEKADDAFWRALEYFGPPAKDFRWCCKTCKLGPAAKLIRSQYPNGVLSFIGQRQYES
ncbi:MAG: phosphoadenosine phosphosulfate reductase family protein, partial [Thermoplasmata archaeon]|nr:phosphoadenosine phosphosulfate reductase family protein [Thermoplasmata archaeon]